MKRHKWTDLKALRARVAASRSIGFTDGGISASRPREAVATRPVGSEMVAGRAADNTDRFSHRRRTPCGGGIRLVGAWRMRRW
jgi:hypothetical protein